ncbi:MAG: amidohydrolase family protein [Deltaproteobacteria bacterium]|jgi:cytosine/adenosine deaminase-related metal-dependent hydrolase|nr:amidohydrolase family protein [Deltaproteobacteria bacterium]MBW2521485.1 amidohydrolase family protein [Deltaproteobacteria bacterium]
MTGERSDKLHPAALPVIHRAPWLVTGLASGDAGGGALVADGALAVAGGIIRCVGTFPEVVRQLGGCRIIEHESAVLTPALVNSHCHLELSRSALAEQYEGRPGYDGDPTGWIRDLLAEKDSLAGENSGGDSGMLTRARQTLQQMAAEGIGFVGDVGNSLAAEMVGHGQDVRVAFLLELLGLSREAEESSLARLERMGSDGPTVVNCTAHAPYSTAPAVIRAVKQRATRRGHPFSIHVAESEPEVEFLQNGSGVLREFLEERRAWDGSFRIPEKGAIDYLDSLGVLDGTTLCVHAVHVSEAEITIMAEKKAKVCLCPGSNRFLGVGKAPVTEFLARGILPALGTDSRASNRILSMWREMRLLRQDHPALEPETVFGMATRAGAEAWGVASQIGTLEPGREARVLAVDGGTAIKRAADVFEFLTSAGETVRAEWVEQKDDDG